MPIYVVNHSAISVSTAITIIQIKAGATRPLRIIRAWCTQSNLTTSAQQRIQLLRKTAAATVTSFTPLLYNPGDSAANAAGGTTSTGITASGEGTDGDILVGDVFNLLTGWLYLPVPEERPLVLPAGFIALKFPAAPAAATTFTAGIVFEEI